MRADNWLPITCALAETRDRGVLVANNVSAFVALGDLLEFKDGTELLQVVEVKGRHAVIVSRDHDGLGAVFHAAGSRVRPVAGWRRTNA